MSYIDKLFRTLLHFHVINLEWNLWGEYLMAKYFYKYINVYKCNNSQIKEFSNISFADQFCIKYKYINIYDAYLRFP